MIVKCEQCQTRFKIPDDKVTEKGVKVRCTKCQHTFRVKRDAAAADATAPAGAPLDPFAKFGSGAPPAEPAESTRPSVYALGVQATKPPLPPSFEAQADLPPEAFDSPTRVQQLPPPPPGRKPLTDPAPAPFDFSAFAPPPAPAAPAPKSGGFEPQPFDFGALSPPAAPAPTDVTQRAPIPGPPKASAFEPQPFDFSALSAPAAPPSTTEVTRRERAPQPPRASAFDPQPFDFSSLGSGETTQKEALRQPAAPAPIAPSTFEPQPFDFSALGSTGAPPPPPPQHAPPPPHRPAPSAPRGPPPSAPPAKTQPHKMPTSSAPATFDMAEPMDFGPPPPAELPPARAVPPRASPSAVTQVEQPAVFEPPPAPPGILGDIPADTGSLSIDVDDGMEAMPGARGALFDMSAVPEPTENQLAPQPEQVAVAKIQLKKVSADQLSKPAPQTEGHVSSSKRPRRSVVAVVWNAVSFLVLLVLLGGLVTVVINEGKVDAALSWSKLKALFSKPRELVAFDISNGLYDTRAGRPVFYVRGEVKNRGQNTGRVKVKAEILDGEELVRAAEGWAGATPSPEDLYAVTTAEDLSKLATRLAPNAVQLQPGSEAGFLVTFYEYPPDLKDFRVRVTVSPDDGTTAAR